jgi:hypothetical protein
VSEFEGPGWDVEEPDSYTEAAKVAVMGLFAEHPEEVFYSRQLEVRFEDKFFHWVTNRAVRRLVDEGALKVVEVPLGGGTRVKFLMRPRLRYYTRAVNRSMRVVRRYSDHPVASACGDQAEHLFLVALARRRFVCVGENTNEHGERKWTESNHNLDFVIERDGVTYGCEVKNTLDYIDHDELRVKLEICECLGIVPLFIMRWAPKTYVREVVEAGGYGMLFKAQVYPFGYVELVRDIKAVLGLPADSPRAIPEGIITRFMNWHAGRVGR